MGHSVFHFKLTAVSFCLGAYAASCASQPSSPQVNAPSHAVGLSGIGKIRRDTLGKAEGSYPEKITLRLDLDGNIEKIAAHRKDYQHVPVIVRREVAERLPGASFREYELNLYPDEQRRVYAVQVRTAKDEICEVSIKESGEYRHMSCEIEMAQLPGIVRTVVAQAVPSGRIVSVEVRRDEDQTARYNIKVIEGQHMYRFLVLPDGRIIDRKIRIPAWVELPL